MQMKWLTRQMILAMRDEAVVIFGGLPGVRGCLEIKPYKRRPCFTYQAWRKTDLLDNRSLVMLLEISKGLIC